MLHLPYRIESKDKKHKTTETHVDEIDYRIHRQHNTISKRTNSELTSSYYDDDDDDDDDDSVDSIDSFNISNHRVAENAEEVQNLHNENECSCCIGKYFDVPPPLIVCLVRHMNKERKPITTPSSIEKCVRDLQSYFTPSIAASSIQPLNESNFVSQHKDDNNDIIFYENNGNIVYNKENMTDEHKKFESHVKLEFGKSLDVFEPLSSLRTERKTNGVIESNVQINSKTNNTTKNHSNIAMSAGNQTNHTTTTASSSGSNNKADNNVKPMHAKELEEYEQEELSEDNDVANNVLLYICLYAIDEGTSSPAILRQMASDWRKTLQLNGKQEDILFMLYHKDIAYQAEKEQDGRETTDVINKMEWEKKEMNESVNSKTEREDEKLENYLRQSSSSDKKIINNNNNNNNQSANNRFEQDAQTSSSKDDSSHLETTKTIRSETTKMTSNKPNIKLSKWGLHTMVDYMTASSTVTPMSTRAHSNSSNNESPVHSHFASLTSSPLSGVAIRTKNTSVRTRAIEPYFAELQALHFTPAQMCVYTSQDAHLFVIDAIWHAQQRRVDKLTSDVEKYAAQQRRLPLAAHEKLNYDYLREYMKRSVENGNNDDDNDASNNNRLADLHNTRKETEKLTEHVQHEYWSIQHYWRLGYRLVVQYLQFGKLQQCQLTFDKMLHMYYNNSDDFALMRQSNTMHKLSKKGERLFAIYRHSAEHVMHYAIDLLRGLVWVVACEMHCALMLRDLESVEHTLRLFMQILKEKFDEENKLMSLIIVEMTSSTTHKKTDLRFRKMTRHNDQHLFQLQCYLSALHLFFKFVCIEEPESTQSDITHYVVEDNHNYINDSESDKKEEEREEEFVIEDVLESYMQTVNLCTIKEEKNSKTDILMELIHHLHDRITSFLTINTNNKKGHKSTKRISDGRYNRSSRNNNKKLSDAELEVIASLCLSARDVTYGIDVELEKLDKGNDNKEMLHSREQGLLTSQNALKEEWQELILAAACCYRELHKVEYNKLEFTLWLSLCVSYANTHTRLAKNIAVYLLHSLHAENVTLQNKSVFQWHAIMQLLQEIWIDCVWREINQISSSSSSGSSSSGSTNNIIITSVASSQDEQMQIMKDVMANTFASLQMYNMYVSSLIDRIKDYANAKQMKYIKLGQFAFYTHAHDPGESDDSNANDVTYKYWQRLLQIDHLVKECGLFNEESQYATRHDLSRIATDFSFHVHLINSITSTPHTDSNSTIYNNNLQLTDTAGNNEKETTPVAHYKINDSVEIVLSMNCFIDLFNNSHQSLLEKETQTTIAPARVKLTLESCQDWEDDNEPVHVVTLQNYTVTAQITSPPKMNINNDKTMATNVYHIELTFPFNICHAGQYCVKNIQINVNSTELCYEYEEHDRLSYNNDYKNCRGLTENCNRQEYGNTLFHVEEHVEEELIISMAKIENNKNIRDVDLRKNMPNELHNQYKQLWKEEQSVGIKRANADEHYFADMPSSFALRIDGVQLQEDLNIYNSTEIKSIDSMEKNIMIKNDNINNVADSSVQKCYFKVSEVLTEEEEMENEEEEEESEEEELHQQTVEQVKSIDISRHNKLILFPTCKFSFLQNKNSLFDDKSYKQQGEHMEKVAQSCNNIDNAEVNNENNNNNKKHQLVKKTQAQNKTSLDQISPFNSFSSFASASFWQPSALQPNASLFGVMQVKLSPPHFNNVHSSFSQEQKYVESYAAQICVTAKGQTYLLNKSFALQSTPKSYNVNCKTNNDINDVNTNKNAIDLSSSKQETSSSALLHPISASPGMESPSAMLLSPSSDKKSFVNNTSICSELCKNDAIMHVCLFHKSEYHNDNVSFTSIPCLLSELLSPHAAQTTSLLENAKVEWTCESKYAELPELSIHAVPLHSLSSLLRHGLHFRLVKESNESTTDKVDDNIVKSDKDVKTSTQELQIEKVNLTSCSLLVSLPILPFLLRSKVDGQQPTNNITSIAEEKKDNIDYTQHVKLSFFQINGDQVRSCVLRSPLFVCEPAFDVRYTFRHLHQRVYCIVSMRTLFTHTSLHFRGALLHVHCACNDDSTEEHNHCNMMCSNIFYKSMTNTNDSDYEVIRVSPIYNHLLECEWKPQMEVQLLFELALKDLSSLTRTNIITTNNMNKSANRVHSVQVQIFYSPWQKHSTKEQEIVEQDEKTKNTVLRYHQKEMYEWSDIDTTTPPTTTIAAADTLDVSENVVSESETESDGGSSSDASSSNELASQALCLNKQIAIQLYEHCNSYWGYCASFDALRNVLFSVHINIVNLNSNRRMIDMKRITENYAGDNRDIDLAKEDSYVNTDDISATRQLELMRFADKIRIGQVVHFAITFVINPANWPEHAAEREEFVVELVVNKSQWNIVGKQRVRRVISLMEGTVVVPFDAIPLPAWRNNSIDGESSKTDSNKNNDQNSNEEQKIHTNHINNNTISSSNSSISSSDSSISNSIRTENATESLNSKKLVANNFSTSNREQLEMTRANMATTASNKESIHTVATPTVRVFWINKHVVCDDDDDRIQSNDGRHVDNCSSIIKLDEGIVGELVNLDIVQFRPTMNIIA